jgi:magnesium-transporting ATPase (P-type)
MIADLLSSAVPVASDILERTASTPRVQQIVSLSLAPAFLLAAIGAIMNVLVSRMIWIANRIERIDDRIEDGRTDPQDEERIWLEKRRALAQVAVMLGTGAAAVISLVIALLFISAWIEAQIGTLIAACWILTMILLIIGLIYFFRETRLAAVGVKSPHRLQNRFWKRTKRKHGGS